MPRTTITALVAAAAACLLAVQPAAADRWRPSDSISGPGSSAPQVALGPQGNITAIWLRDGVLRGAGRAPRGGFKSLGALSGPNASSADIAVGRSGAIGVTWVEHTGPGSWSINSARRIGSHAFSDRQQVATSSEEPHTPRIDLDAAGNPTVAW